MNSSPQKYVIGAVFGNKKIISYHGHNKYSQPCYIWQCLRCGSEFGPTTGPNIVRTPYSKCCPRRYDEKANYKGYRLITGSKMTQYRDSARRRNLDFSIDAQYLWKIWEIQDGICAYTGKNIELNKDASLDRIDSSKGYIQGNVQWVSWIVNRMKLNIPHDEFIKICKDVAEYNKGKENDFN